MEEAVDLVEDESSEQEEVVKKLKVGDALTHPGVGSGTRCSGRICNKKR